MSCIPLSSLMDELSRDEINVNGKKVTVVQ